MFRKKKAFVVVCEITGSAFAVILSGIDVDLCLLSPLFVSDNRRNWQLSFMASHTGKRKSTICSSVAATH